MKTDANSKFSATPRIHADEIARVFQFGNENIYDYKAEKLSFGYEMTYGTLSNFGLAMAQHFTPENLTEDAIMNVKLNSKGGFFCTTYNPIQGTDRKALSIIIGTMDMKAITAVINGKEEDFIGQFDLVFALTGEIDKGGYFTPGESVVMAICDGAKKYVTSSTAAAQSYKQHICYADEAFKAVVADEVPVAETCQDWFHPESDVDEQYCYITQRSPEDLAHDLMDTDTESDLEPTTTFAVAPHLH